MNFDVGQAHRPHPQELLCGDASLVMEYAWGIKCLIVDGVGHGQKAHRVAAQLVSFECESLVRDPCECLKALHRAASGSEGAVAGVLCVERSSGQLHYAALGNTVARVFGVHRQRFISQDGVLGQRMRSVLLQSAQLSPGDVVVLHTDGISSNFDVVSLPELRGGGAQYAAGALLGRFAKCHDDAACIVVKVLP